jgi:hypothetical protein
MKSARIILLVWICTAFALIGCTNNDSPNSTTEKLVSNDQPAETKATDVEDDLLGNYHGVQPGYFLKNQDGSDMVIAGNKVPVPSSDYIFLIKENNVVSLQQTNLEDGRRVYYNGTYKVIQKVSKDITIECALSDGEYSNPTYTLNINSSSKSGTCAGSNEPIFNIEKQNQ